MKQVQISYKTLLLTVIVVILTLTLSLGINMLFQDIKKNYIDTHYNQIISDIIYIFIILILLLIFLLIGRHTSVAKNLLTKYT